MIEPKEKVIAVTYALPAAQIDFIRDMAHKGIMGDTESAVLRELLYVAIFELTKSRYIPKWVESVNAIAARAKERP